MDIEKFRNNQDKVQKMLLLNLMSKSIMDHDREFVKMVDSTLEKANKNNAIMIMPILSLSFFVQGNNSKNSESSIPSHWHGVIKKIDVSQKDTPSLHDAIKSLISDCNIRFFHVEGMKTISSIYGIKISSDTLIKSLCENGLIPIVIFNIEKSEDINKIDALIFNLVKVLKIDSLDISAIFSIHFTGSSFMYTTGIIESVINKIITNLESSGLNRNKFKIILGGDVVDYLAISEEEASLVDGLLLTAYDGDENVIYHKISKIIDII